MVHKILLGSALIILSMIQTTFAIATPNNVSIENTTGDSATISWETVEGAVAYSLYYGTDNSALTQYDLAEVSPHTLAGLENNTQYYVEIRSNDSEFNESEASQQLSFTTGESSPVSNETNSGDAFAVEKVDVLDATHLLLTFSTAVNAGEQEEVDIKIVAQIDPSDTKTIVNIENHEENERQLVIELENSLEINSEYTLTVLELSDVNGQSIEKGIDGIASFITPVEFDEAQSIESGELSSAGSEPEDSEQASQVGSEIADEDIAVTAESVAEKAEELPTTGAEHWFLGILALVLGALLFGFRFSKN